jgi:phage host-nuclease inhibitor protein Gam
MAISGKDGKDGRADALAPADANEAAKFLSQIGKEKREIEKIQAKLNAEVEGLKLSAVAKAKPRQRRIEELIKGLFVFAEMNRDALTEHGKRKTVRVPTGTFGWRMTPRSVTLRNVESILKKLKSFGLERFIRIKEEVDKEAMLREPDTAKTVKGVSISQHEEFVAKPDELKMEIATNINKLRKTAA